jgi:hypothetical protein
MKRKTAFYISLASTLIIGVVAMLGAFGVIDLGSLMGGEGVIWAVAGAATIVTAEPVTTTNAATASADLDIPKLDKAITIMRPDLYPLDTLLRSVGGAERINAWKYEWYATDYRGYTDTLKNEFDKDASSTGVHTLYVTNIHFWTVHDTGLIPDYTDDDGGPIMFLVIAKSTSASSLTVIPAGITTGTIPDMAAGTTLVRMGVAKNELDAQTSQYAVFPQKSYNYCQYQMKQVEESFFQKAHNKEVEWNIDDFKAAALEDLRRGMELTAWFGKKGVLTDTEADNEKYTTDGVIRNITKSIDYDLTPANANKEWLSITNQIFKGNAGSKTRYLFGGSDFMEWVGTIETVYKQRDAGSVKEEYGLLFDRVRTNYGTLQLMYHQLFDDAGYSDKGVVLDMNNIYRKVWNPLDVRKIELKKSGIKNADAYAIDETSMVIVKYPLTHAILQPSNS